MTEAQVKEMESISSQGSFGKLIENRTNVIYHETPKVSRYGANSEYLKRLELTFSNKVKEREKSSPAQPPAPNPIVELRICKKCKNKECKEGSICGIRPNISQNGQLIVMFACLMIQFHHIIDATKVIEEYGFKLKNDKM